ncbi:gamma-butyrobetaine hydroxylase-like domain-containing protein [Hoeflea sp.]|uniref:gamma-butyrobetaine hydroxylase-like domain-containing protein n=1 Tax=Hoeflea sp. TaxID=1940281 RepID=UPI003B02B2E6
MEQTETIRPTEMRVSRDRQTLTVAFGDTDSFALPAEALRVLSPSAEVQGHAPDQRVTVPGKRQVRITGMEPVGNYAVRIVFDDGHNTGLFTWKYLLSLGQDFERHWSGYLAELEDKGMSRDRPEPPR